MREVTHSVPFASLYFNDKSLIFVWEMLQYNSSLPLQASILSETD